jgi:hypothetical protein
MKRKSPQPVPVAARVVGIGLVALGVSTWPNIHWEGVILGIGFYFGPQFGGGSK